jgi:hypothetical protein
MRKLFFPGLAALLWALGTTTAAWADEAKPAALELPDKVTFSDHVAPIIFGNCTACHRPGEAAPFQLLTYRDVQKRGRTILKVVERRYMPPWQPEPGHGEFRDERRLSDHPIALLRRWVQTGMAEGDPKRLPALPKFSDGWYLGKPDLVVTMDRALNVPADGPDLYRNFVLRLNLPEDKWVTAIELRPSARGVVHHALFFSDGNRSVSKIVRLHYRDGKTEDHPMKNGEHFADYIRRIDVPGSQFAFKMKGPQQLRYLAITPRRHETIESLESIKGTDRTAPIVMAVTIETLP